MQWHIVQKYDYYKNSSTWFESKRWNFGGFGWLIRQNTTVTYKTKYPLLFKQKRNEPLFKVLRCKALALPCDATTVTQLVDVLAAACHVCASARLKIFRRRTTTGTDILITIKEQLRNLVWFWYKRKTIWYKRLSPNTTKSSNFHLQLSLSWFHIQLPNLQIYCQLACDSQLRRKSSQINSQESFLWYARLLSHLV